MMRYFLLLLFCCVVSGFARAQDPSYKILNKEVGLPSNDVFGIMQDSKGFLWFTTNDGLSRYDGFEYISFDNPLLSSRSGDQPHEDAFGRVWYMNFDGRLYYVENNVLKAFKPKQSKPTYSVYAIIGRYLYYFTENTLNIVEMSDLNLIKQIPISNAVGLGSTKTEFFYTFDFGVYSINEYFEPKKLNITPTKNYTTRCTSDKSEYATIYMGDKASLANQYHLYNIKQPEKGFPVNLDRGLFLQNICTSNDSTLWLCTTQGAYCFDSRTMKPKYNGFRFFKNRSITKVLADTEGSYWFTTTNNGVLYVPNFESEKIDLSDDNPPTRLAALSNVVCIGTQKGDILALERSKIVPIVHHSVSSAVYQIYVDTPAQHIYYSTNAFMKYDMRTKKTSKKDIAVKQLCRIDDAFLAYSASGICGLLYAPIYKNAEKTSIWNSNFEKTRRISLGFPDFSVFLSNIRGKSLAFRKTDHTIFYLTNTGLWAVKPNSTTRLAIPDSTFFPTTIVSNGKRILGLTTKGQIFEIAANNTIYFPPRPSKNKVQQIRLFGDILIFKTKQRFFYDDISIATSPQPLRNILNTDDINDFLLKGNDFYVTTSRSALRYKLSTLIKQDLLPRLQINYVQQDTLRYAPDSLPNFTYKQNSIHINYSILLYRTQSFANLFYRINGSKNWSPLPTHTHTLSLDALAPHDYVIDFRFDTDTEPIASLHFTISPPLWEQPWFIILLIGLALLSIIEYNRRQIRRRNAAHKAQLELTKLENDVRASRLSAIKAQMNPHFFYNALNTIQSYIYENDKRNASTFLNKFSKLTRLILEFSERDAISLQEEIGALRLYLDIEQSRFDEGDFQYNINCAADLDTEMIKIPSMIVQPYVENAIKHGLLHKKGAKLLTITLERFSQLLYITVDDNGIGRKRSEAIQKARNEDHRSFASQANLTRIELLNQRAENINVVYHDKIDESEQALGTTVVLCIQI